MAIAKRMFKGIILLQSTNLEHADLVFLILFLLLHLRMLHVLHVTHYPLLGLRVLFRLERIALEFVRVLE